MIKYVIVGLDIYQGMEFLLERGVSDVKGRLGVAGSRLYGSMRLVGRAPAYRFVLDTLRTFLERD